MKANKSILALAAAASALLLAHSADAAQYHVTVDTSALLGSPAAPFSLDFQLIGNGGDLANSVTLSNFTFGSGSPTNNPGPTYFGIASGDLSSTVSLGVNSSSTYNEFFQDFAAGTILGFDVDLSTNVNGPTPDGFSFSILDADLLNIETNGVGNSLFLISINSASPTVESFTSLSGVTVSVAPVPEPSTLLFGVGVLGAVGVFRRRTRVA